jgi:hypothetical protein
MDRRYTLVYPYKSTEPATKLILSERELHDWIARWFLDEHQTDSFYVERMSETAGEINGKIRAGLGTAHG